MVSGTGGGCSLHGLERPTPARDKASRLSASADEGRTGPGGVTDVSTARPSPAGTVVAMTATTHAAARSRARTGGPKDDGPKILEHVLGWTLVVVLAMFVTQAGLM